MSDEHTTDYLGTDLTGYSNRQIILRYTSLEAQVKEMRADMDAYKTELIRRMKSEQATTLADADYDVLLVRGKTEYSYSLETAQKIIETAKAMNIPQSLIDKAVLIETEPQVKVKRIGLTKLAKYGLALQALLDDCKITEKDEKFTCSKRKA